jgi:hypothetical protein
MPSDPAFYFSAPDIPVRTLLSLRTTVERIRSSYANALAELDELRGGSRTRLFGSKLATSAAFLRFEITAVMDSFGGDLEFSAEHAALFRSMENLAEELSEVEKVLGTGRGVAGGTKALDMFRKIYDAFRSPLSILDFLIGERERMPS